MGIESILKKEEKIIFELRSLYQKYGYAPFKMSKFEEYDLYAGNKEFLMSDHIITFTDTNGKLMALKPDVTLSIVRNARVQKDTVQKVYYNENVYRVSKGTHGFKEQMQVGLECIGDVDNYNLYEVLMLAARSLKRISSEGVLQIAHLGIIAECLAALEVDSETERGLLKCMEEKNLHEMKRLGEQADIDAAKLEVLQTLMRLSGTPAEVLPKVRELGFDNEATVQLESILTILQAQGYADCIRLDFSTVSDLKYYNGIVFQGYVPGVPNAVLAGGQYDRLMKKMGKGKYKAVGFAVFMDQLERLGRSEHRFDVDLVLLYDDDTKLETLCKAVKTLSETNVSVMVEKQIPEKLKYRLLGRLAGDEVTIVEDNA